MDKINLLLIVGGIAIILLLLLYLLTMKKKVKYDTLKGDLLLIQKVKQNAKGFDVIKVDPIELKNKKFNKLYEKLSKRMNISIDPVEIPEEEKKELEKIEEVKNSILKEIESISKRRQELAEVT